MSDSVQLHRRQPTRFPRPWDSPGKNTGVGCHFLLQCRKVKSESEVTQSCLTLSDPMDCSLPGSSVHGIFQARVLEWGAIYNVVLISAVQQDESVIRMYFFMFFSVMVYQRILNIVQYKTLFTLYIRVTILSVQFGGI